MVAVRDETGFTNTITPCCCWASSKYEAEGWAMTKARESNPEAYQYFVAMSPADPNDCVDLTKEK